MGELADERINRILDATIEKYEQGEAWLVIRKQQKQCANNAYTMQKEGVRGKSK